MPKRFELFKIPSKRDENNEHINSNSVHIVKVKHYSEYYYQQQFNQAQFE